MDVSHKNSKILSQNVMIFSKLCSGIVMIIMVIFSLKFAENLDHGRINMFSRYLVTPLMGADLNNIMKVQALTDEHVQFLIYQLLRGLKVSPILH